MSGKNSTWIRVKAEGELRPGLTVELRPCGFCGRRERLILLRAGYKELSLHHSGDMVPGEGRGWLVAPGLCLNPTRPVDLSVSISTGRLWRLADPDLEESTTEGNQMTVTGSRRTNGQR